MYLAVPGHFHILQLIRTLSAISKIEIQDLRAKKFNLFGLRLGLSLNLGGFLAAGSGVDVGNTLTNGCGVGPGLGSPVCWGKWKATCDHKRNLSSVSSTHKEEKLAPE